MFLFISPQGVVSLKKTDLDCYYIFVNAPSFEELVSDNSYFFLMVGVVGGDLGAGLKYILRQFSLDGIKPRSKPFSILPTIVSKPCVLPTVTRRIASPGP